MGPFTAITTGVFAAATGVFVGQHVDPAIATVVLLTTGWLIFLAIILDVVDD